MSDFVELELVENQRDFEGILIVSSVATLYSEHGEVLRLIKLFQ